tara:strand:- start:5170 stop:5454 length:285 start_codon:yes stop_codon:yes gene_type:complete
MTLLDGITKSVNKFVEGAFSEVFKGVEQRINREIDVFKKKIMKSLLEVIFFILAILFLVWGGIMIISNYFLIEYVLIAAGVLFLYAGLMVKMMK